jgi:uncharacterized protein (TIGR00730 family)
MNSLPIPPSNNPNCIPLNDETAVREVLQQTILNLWDTVNNLTRLRPTNRESYRVTIFGSARVKPGSAIYDDVKRLASVLTEMECEIITGGGPGLMQAANEGAMMACKNDTGCSVGIRVHLPFEQGANPYVKQVFEHRTFFTRLHHFVFISDAFIVVPGGIGTVLELMMVWQLLQVKHLYNTPLILVGKMYADLIEWARDHLLETDPQPSFVNVEDIDIPICVDTVDEALEVVKNYRAKQRET